MTIPVRDPFHDPGWGTMRQLFDRFPKMANYVGDLELTSANGENLANHAYADESRRYFPIYDAKVAALSYSYARDQKVTGPVMAQIKEALDAFSVPSEIFEYEVVKTAAPLAPEECLFPEQGTWPIRTDDEVRAAEAKLASEYTKLLPETRVAAFGRLYKRAVALGLTPSPLTHKYAGHVATDATVLRDTLAARAVSAEKTAKDRSIGATIAAGFRKLSETVAAKPRALLDRATQTKLAAAIGDLDVAAGLTHRYDHGVPDPVATVFNTEKIARTDDIDLAGERFALAKLAGLPASFYQDALGDDFAKELSADGGISSTKLSQILPTLPLDMKRVLATALRSTGR